MKNRGFTLIETVIVIGIVALLAVISIPSIYLSQSFNEIGCSKGIFNSIFSLAKNTAISQSRYAGIRFQQTEKSIQYAIFIISQQPYPYVENNALINKTIRCVAMKGRKPIKLSVNIKSENDDKYVTVLFSPTGQLVTKSVIITRASNPDSNEEDLPDDIFDNRYPSLLEEDYIIRSTNKSFRIKDTSYHINSYTGQIIN